MHKLIDNNHDLDGISLHYPEDCEDYTVFRCVANSLDAFVTIKEGGRLVMDGFGQNINELEVE